MAVRAVPTPRSLATTIRTLGSLRDPALLLDLEGTILFANDAWERSTRDDTGAPRCAPGSLVGTPWVEHVLGDAPRRMIAERFAHALASGASGAIAWTSERNDVATARLVTTRLEPVIVPPGAIAGLTMIRRLVRERPIAEVYDPVPLDGRSYRGADGATAQCSCCRRTRRPAAPEEWDFVPELLALPPPDTRFVFCPLCLELHG